MFKEGGICCINIRLFLHSKTLSKKLHLILFKLKWINQHNFLVFLKIDLSLYLEALNNYAGLVVLV